MNQIKNLFMAKDVLSDCYGISIPDELLVSIIENNPELLMEVETGGVRDTCISEDLGHAVMTRLNMPPWPTYGDITKDSALYDRFIGELKIAVRTVGGEFIC